MPLHEDQTAANRHALNTLNTAAKLAGGDTAFSALIAPLTSVGVDASTPLSYKKAMADIAATQHEDTRYALVRAAKAADAMKAAGVYTDGVGGTIDLANDTAGMRTLHKNAVTPVIPDADLTQQGSVLWGE